MGSFTSAAKAIGLTQSGITRAIADLERELGYAIFYRTARGVLLTEDGREFVDRARQLLDDARSLLNGGLERNPFAQTLRIGVCPSSLEWTISEPITKLITRHPEIRFEIIGGSFERIVQMLRSGRVDIAVGLEEAFNQAADIKTDGMGEYPLIMFARLGHPILSSNDIQSDDLSSFPIVLPSDSPPYSEIARQMFQRRGLSWQRHIHFSDNFHIVRRIVMASDALSIATREFSLTPSFPEHFAIVPTDIPFPNPLKICCATRSHWEVTVAARAFMKLAREQRPS